MADKFTTEFTLEQPDPNKIFKVFDEGNGDGLRFLINDSVAETKFGIEREDIFRLIEFLKFYVESQSL